MLGSHNILNPANGAPITAYKIEIQTTDGSWIEDLVGCDGSAVLVRTNTEC